MRTTFPRALLALLLALTLWPVAAARAQMGDMGEMMILANPLTKRSVDSAKAILGLDAEQLDVVNDLYAGYRAAMKTAQQDAAAKQKEMFEKAQKEGDFDAIRKGMMEIMNKTFEDVEKLEKGFNDDLKAVLRPEQVDTLPAYERARRRESARLVQVMAGEGADLFDILHILKIDWKVNADLAAVLNDYDMSLDRTLASRLSMFKDFIKKMMGSDGAEMEAVKEFLPKLYGQAKVARDLNRQTARRVGELLPEADKARFEEAFRSRSFVNVYKQSATSKKLAAAAKFTDLTEAQKSELESMTKNYTRDLEAANATWTRAIDTVQENVAANVEKMFDGDSPDDEASDKAREARAALDKTYADRLAALLTKEQVERLPVTRESDELDHNSGAEPEIDREAIKEWAGEGGD